MAVDCIVNTGTCIRCLPSLNLTGTTPSFYFVLCTLYSISGEHPTRLHPIVKWHLQMIDHTWNPDFARLGEPRVRKGWAPRLSYAIEVVCISPMQGGKGLKSLIWGYSVLEVVLLYVVQWLKAFVFYYFYWIPTMSIIMRVLSEYSRSSIFYILHLKTNHW